MSNSVSILFKIRQIGERVIGNIEGGLKRLDVASNAYRATLAGTSSSAQQFTSTMLRLAAVIGGGDLFRRTGQSAFSFNNTVEQSRIGIAALIRTFNDFTDANGNLVDAQTAYTESMKMAEKIQRDLQIAGLETIATYEQLLTVMQEGLGPAFKAGFNPDQIVKFTSSMMQAGAALTVPMHQMGQEIRAILDGTIDRNARIAVALGLTNEKIKEMTSSGQLFDFLMVKLREFQIAGEDTAKTFSGAMSNLGDAIQIALGRGIEGTFRKTIQLILDLKDAIVTIDKETGEIHFNEKVEEALSKVDAAIVNFLSRAGNLDEWVGRVAVIFGDLVVVAVELAGALGKVIEVLGPYLPMMVKVIAYFAAFRLAMALVVGLPLAIATQVKALIVAINILTGGKILVFLASLKAGFAGVAVSAGLAAVAFKATLALAAAMAVVEIGKLVKALWDYHRASKRLKEAQDDLAEQQQYVEPKITGKLKEISKATGLVIADMREFNRLVKEGAIVFEEASGKWIKGGGGPKPDDVTIKLKPQPADPAEEKKAIADQTRLQEQLANDLIKISGDKWEVMRKQAKKYYEDQLKLAHGNATLIEQAKIVYNARLAEIDQQFAEETAKEAKRLTDAQIKSQIARMQASGNTAIKILEDAYNRGAIAVRDFFRVRRDMTEQEFQTELTFLQQQAEAEADVVDQLRVQDEIFQLQEQHKQDLIQLSNEQADAEARIAEQAERVRQILAGINVRTLAGSPDFFDNLQAESLYTDEMHDEEIRRLQELNATKEELDEAYRKHKLEKDRLAVEQERAIWERRLSMAQDVAYGLESIFSGLYELSGQKSKEMFYLAKAAAIAEAIVNAALAITKAYAQGGIWGHIQAGVIAAATGVQIAKIQAQQLAYGGMVGGRSPHSRADNIPVMATAGEYVHPVDSVIYYGRSFMEAIRKKKLSRMAADSLLKGVSVTLPPLRPQYAFASGGQVVSGGRATTGDTRYEIHVPVTVNGAGDTDRVSRVLPGEIEKTVIRVIREHMR